MMVPDLTGGVDEVVRRPVLVLKGAPNRVAVVDRDWIPNLQIGDRRVDVGDVLLERELGRVYADDDESLPVLGGPRADVGKRPQAVDARVRPEVDHDDLAAKAFSR